MKKWCLQMKPLRELPWLTVRRFWFRWSALRAMRRVQGSRGFQYKVVEDKSV